MKKLIAAAVFLLVLSSAAPAAERFAATKGSMVKIEGTSTLHNWSMEGSTINGQVSVPSDWKAGLNESMVNVSIPVTSIKSEHDRMDRIMGEALKAKENPEIVFRLTSAALKGSSTVQSTGKLTIAGTTRDVTIDVTVMQDGDGQYTLTGIAPIKMTDFGIKPPVTMMGTLKTGNDVTVTFRWVVATAK
jgi:polyisoprenoid-binding protein YceI